MGFGYSNLGAVNRGGYRGGARLVAFRGGRVNFQPRTFRAGGFFHPAGRSFGGNGWAGHIARHYAHIGWLQRQYAKALRTGSAWSYPGGGAGGPGYGGGGGYGGGDSGGGGQADSGGILQQLEQQIQQLTQEVQSMQQAQASGQPAPDAGANAPTGTAAAMQSLSQSTNGSISPMSGLGDWREHRFGDDRFRRFGWGNRPWNWLHPGERRPFEWWRRL